MVNLRASQRSSTPVTDIHMHAHIQAKPQIEHDHLPHTNAIGNNMHHNHHNNYDDIY